MEKTVRQIGWTQVEKIWLEYLWPDRNTVSRMSSLIDAKNHNKVIYESYQPYFFGCIIDDKLVGVNSGHQTSRTHFRSRGLYVFPEWRRHGIGVELINATVQKAVQQQCKYIWTMPRKNALSTYEKCGFEKKSPWFDTGTHMDRTIKLSEANCYAERKLDE